MVYVRYGSGGTHVIKMFDNIIISFPIYNALEELVGSTPASQFWHWRCSCFSQRERRRRVQAFDFIVASARTFAGGPLCLCPALVCRSDSGEHTQSGMVFMHVLLERACCGGSVSSIVVIFSYTFLPYLGGNLLRAEW